MHCICIGYILFAHVIRRAYHYIYIYIYIYIYHYYYCYVLRAISRVFPCMRNKRTLLHNRTGGFRTILRNVRRYNLPKKFMLQFT